MGSVTGDTVNAARLATVGIAPFLAAVLIVGLLVAGVLMPLGVGAHPCGPETEHNDFHGVSCIESGHDDPHQEVIEVDAGRDRELVFKVFPPDVDKRPL